MKAAFAILCLLIAPVQASDWTPADSHRELTFLTVLAVDVSQTLNIVDKHAQGYDYYEQNTLLLSENPSRGEVISYGILWAGAHYAVARWLDPGNRWWWQNIAIGAHAVAVANNAHRGLEIDDSAKPFVATMLTVRITF